MFLYLGKLLFLGFLQFQGNSLLGQNNFKIQWLNFLGRVQSEFMTALSLCHNLFRKWLRHIHWTGEFIGIDTNCSFRWRAWPGYSAVSTEYITRHGVSAGHSGYTQGNWLPGYSVGMCVTMVNQSCFVHEYTFCKSLITSFYLVSVIIINIISDYPKLALSPLIQICLKIDSI